jgi:hypothetical protein
MAVLTNLGVPTTGGVAQQTLMPKLQYRFRVTFGFDTSEIVTSNVMSVTRPTFSHEEVVVDVYNSKIYVAGKHTWDPVTITMRDDVNNNVITSLNNQLNYQIDMADQSAPLAGGQYKFSMKIETLDGGNAGATSLDTWTLGGCFLQNVAYGESNYATSDAQSITCTVRYDNVCHHDGSDRADDLLSGQPAEGPTVTLASGLGVRGLA